MAGYNFPPKKKSKGKKGPTAKDQADALGSMNFPKK